MHLVARVLHETLRLRPQSAENVQGFIQSRRVCRMVCRLSGPGSQPWHETVDITASPAWRGGPCSWPNMQ